MKKNSILKVDLKIFDRKKLDYQSLSKIMLNRGLASLGDVYINFVYSMAISKKKGNLLEKE
jgi:hypothetical protein